MKKFLSIITVMISLSVMSGELNIVNTKEVKPETVSINSEIVPLGSLVNSTVSNVQATKVASNSVASTASVENGQPEINIDNLPDGLVAVKYAHASTLKIKVKITKDNNSYVYNLFSTSDYERFPLQMGNGEYTVSVLKNISGTSYSTVKTFKVTLNDSSKVFVNSNQQINWNSSLDAVVKAKNIASGLTSDAEKAKAVHDFLISYMSYDYDKAATVSTNYVPDITTVYNNKTGICYDFASTYAAMMRSLGVPTKLVMGTTVNVNGYHAWNEVLINGSWVVVDNSYDSQIKASGLSASMIKKKDNYSKTKEF